MAQLQVTLVKGKDLKQKDRFSESDAYVKIYLRDGLHDKQRSTTKDNSNNPQWNETFVFNHCQGEDILHLDVYDHDPVKDQAIGSLAIDLHELYERGHLDQWFNIRDKVGSTSPQGQLHLRLVYERLTV